MLTIFYFVTLFNLIDKKKSLFLKFWLKITIDDTILYTLLL